MTGKKKGADARDSAIKRMVQSLALAGCSYTITTPNGESLWGGSEPHRKKTQSFKGYIAPIIEKIGRGTLAEIPFPKDLPEDKVESFQSSISAYCGRIFGREEYATCLKRERGVVEVYRQ